MEIIENTGMRVLRLNIERPSYWWESSILPEKITCYIQELTTEGGITLRLSIDTLEKIAELAQSDRAKMQEEWAFPTTDCCNTKMPRENTTVEPYGEGSIILCKRGFGCKSEKAIAKEA